MNSNLAKIVSTSQEQELAYKVIEECCAALKGISKHYIAVNKIQEHFGMRMYNEQYDAIYDENKDVWLEGKCSDSECMFCAKRPDRPSNANNDAVSEG